MKDESTLKLVVLWLLSVLICLGPASGEIAAAEKENVSADDTSYATAPEKLVKAWTRRYSGPGSGEDWPFGIAVDGMGNVYVTGSSYKASSGYDIATVKYDAAGVRKWVKRYNGEDNGHDYSYGIVVDSTGKVYVAGSLYGGVTTGDDIATIKYDTDGNRKWLKRYNGPDNGSDNANAIAMDNNGDIYVVGSSWRSGTQYDLTTIKYGAGGQRKWVKTYNGPGDKFDYGTAIAVDGSGNVYVTGPSSGGSASGTDYAVVKYDTDGKRQWARRYSGPGSGTDWPNAIAVDADGNVYVAGSSFGSTSDGDFAVVKYSTHGKRKWVRRYNGPGNKFDGANAIAVDQNGSVFVTGQSVGSTSSTDCVTIKYGTKGKRRWVKRYNGPGNGFDYGAAVAVDNNGNVYVAGSSEGTSSGPDYVIIQYKTWGKLQGVKRYNGPGNGEDSPYAIAVDDSGKVYATGKSEGISSGPDFATLKYD